MSYNAVIKKTELYPAIPQPDGTEIHAIIHIYYETGNGIGGQIKFRLLTLPKLLKSLDVEFYEDLVGTFIICEGEDRVGSESAKKIQGILKTDEWVEADT